MNAEAALTLLYWIEERYKILMMRTAQVPKPWSMDPVFQETYFCNVHREHDKVTRWIREYYSDMVNDPMFEYNIIMARFLNWPATLLHLGYQKNYDPKYIDQVLAIRADQGDKVWGGAYVITTHGIKMGKAAYLAWNVLGGAFASLESLRTACRGPSCAVAAQALQGIEGVGSFLSAQIVADLKNTPGHPLFNAEDKRTFVQPGPGSLRGASWFAYGHEKGVSPSSFPGHFKRIREYVDLNWPYIVPPVDNQDLQNCLCEFDKYMRVKNGTGHSKRKYNGAT